MTRRAVATDHAAQRLGRIIAVARTERGWSQAALATESGTTQARIAAIEGSGGNPTLATLTRVLAALDLELAARHAHAEHESATDPRLAAFAAGSASVARRPRSDALLAQRGLLVTLAHRRVRAIVVGGAAAVIHGALHHTDDLDVVYARDAANLDRIAMVLRRLQARLRGLHHAPAIGLDATTLHAGLNFALDTSAGSLDLLGVLTGGGRYEDLIADTHAVTCFGVELRVLSAGALVRNARAVGRPTDLQRAAHLTSAQPRLPRGSTPPDA